MSLYDDLGGAKAIDAVVDSFYKKVLLDNRVSSFFTDTDMERQARKQKSFLKFAFGGPNSYTGQNMTDAHAHLVARGLNDSHVDAIIELIATTLREFDVSEARIKEVAAVAEGVREAVLGRH